MRKKVVAGRRKKTAFFSLVGLVFFIAFRSRAETIDDSRLDYVPPGSEVIENGEIEKEGFKTLFKNYVLALEHRSRSEMQSVATLHFLDSTDILNHFDRHRSSLNLASLDFELFKVIRYKSMKLVSFRMVDKISKKKIEVAPRSWYEVKNDGKIWRIDDFHPDFEPDR